jgi:hypothetical protein
LPVENMKRDFRKAVRVVHRVVFLQSRDDDTLRRRLRAEVNEVGRQYVLMTRRFLDVAAGSRGTVSDLVRAEAHRWKRGHRECADRLAQALDLDFSICSCALLPYRDTVKRGPACKLSDWLLEMVQRVRDESGAGD